MLYPYQEEGIRLLAERGRVILGDEMGVGKTFQGVGAADRVGGNLRLIIAPSILKAKWAAAIEELCPGGKIIIYEASRSEACFAEFNEADEKSGPIWFIFHIEAARQHALRLARIFWDTIVYDEAHRLKSRDSQTFKKFKLLRSTNLFLLTGTPTINESYEIWSLLHLVAPKVYRGFWKFVERHFILTNNGFGIEIGELRSAEALYEEIRPYFIRRLKSEVLNLPEKRFESVPVQLSPQDRKAYDSMVHKMFVEIDGGQYYAPIVLAQITYLKQIAVSHVLLDKTKIRPLTGAKIEATRLILEKYDKVVIFSQFARAVQALEITPEIREFGCVTVHGELSIDERLARINLFRTSSSIRTIALSYQVGGVGIDLFEANCCILLDRPWSPALVGQGVDRIHRIGQKRDVDIYSISAIDTIDQSVDNLLTWKEVSAERVLDMSRKSRSLRKLVMGEGLPSEATAEVPQSHRHGTLSQLF